jgi:hypothetical protein
MKLFLNLGSILLFSLAANTAFAYGSGSSSSHCERPLFTAFQPAPNKYTQSFNEFSIIASANTTPSSVVVHVSVGENKFEFTAKDLTIVPLKNGHLEIKGKMNRPVENGFARISVTAHSKPGCERTDGVLLRIY